MTREESQLRHVDRQWGWEQEDGFWPLCSTRAWLPRDLELMRPVFERMRAEGPASNYVQANVPSGAERQRLLENVEEAFDRLDVLVSNAGMAPRVPARQIFKVFLRQCRHGLDL